MTSDHFQVTIHNYHRGNFFKNSNFKQKYYFLHNFLIENIFKCYIQIISVFKIENKNIFS